MGAGAAKGDLEPSRPRFTGVRLAHPLHEMIARRGNVASRLPPDERLRMIVPSGQAFCARRLPLLRPAIGPAADLLLVEDSRLETTGTLRAGAPSDWHRAVQQHNTPGISPSANRR